MKDDLLASFSALRRHFAAGGRRRLGGAAGSASPDRATGALADQRTIRPDFRHRPDLARPQCHRVQPVRLAVGRLLGAGGRDARDFGAVIVAGLRGRARHAQGGRSVLAAASQKGPDPSGDWADGGQRLSSGARRRYRRAGAIHHCWSGGFHRLDAAQPALGHGGRGCAGGRGRTNGNISVDGVGSRPEGA